MTTSVVPPHPKFIVRLTNGLAIKFHPDRVRNVYEAVTDEEATQFDFRVNAVLTALEYRMRASSFHVEQFNHAGAGANDEVLQPSPGDLPTPSSTTSRAGMALYKSTNNQGNK